MTRDSVLVIVALCAVGLGLLYAVLGSQVSEQWRAWIARASMAAGGVFGIGMLLLGLPGAMFVEAVGGPDLPPDSAWPLSILVTQVGALLVVPSSLLLRFLMPGIVGWGHVGATALLALAATFVFAMLAVGSYLAT